jgi:hypothetical protein
MTDLQADAAFQAQLERMRAEGRPTEHTVGCISNRWHRYDDSGIELTYAILEDVHSSAVLRRVLDGVIEAADDYSKHCDYSGPLVVCVDNTLAVAGDDPRLLRAILKDALDAIQSYDDSYHNKSLTVIRLPDDKGYKVVDVGDGGEGCRGEGEIIGAVVDGIYRFADDEEEEGAALSFEWS